MRCTSDPSSAAFGSDASKITSPPSASTSAARAISMACYSKMASPGAHTSSAIFDVVHARSETGHQGRTICRLHAPTVRRAISDGILSNGV